MTDQKGTLSHFGVVIFDSLCVCMEMVFGLALTRIEISLFLLTVCSNGIQFKEIFKEMAETKSIFI